MKCVLVSFFNSNNLGDLLIGETLYDIVSNEFTVEKVSYSGVPKVINSGFVAYERKRSYKSDVIELFKRMGLGFFAGAYYKYIKTIDLEYFKSKISNADVLVIGGGNMIFDLDKYSSSASRFNNFINIAKEYKKRIFAISLGIGPFQTSKQAFEAVKALEKCDYISFRDRASYEIFKVHNKTHKNVYVSIDPVFSLPQEVNFKINPDSHISLNIINNKLLNPSKEDYLFSVKQYVKLAEELVKRLNKRIILFSTEAADYEAVEDVYDLLKSNNKIEMRIISSVSELMDLYGETSVLVGTRMHSMIIALTQRIPIIGLSWQQKVDSLFDIIESQDSVFPYKNIESNIDKIVSCIEDKYANLVDEKRKINNIIELIEKKNEMNIEILKKLQYK